MPHFQESPVCTVNPSADYPEPPGIDLTGQLIILGIQCLLIKSAEIVKPGFVQKHEHPGRKGTAKTRESLGRVVADI